MRLKWPLCQPLQKSPLYRSGYVLDNLKNALLIIMIKGLMHYLCAALIVMPWLAGWLVENQRVSCSLSNTRHLVAIFKMGAMACVCFVCSICCYCCRLLSDLRPPRFPLDLHSFNAKRTLHKNTIGKLKFSLTQQEPTNIFVVVGTWVTLSCAALLGW